MTAKEILTDLFTTFPGLDNGEDDVNGADLVDFLSERAADIRAAIDQETP